MNLSKRDHETLEAIKNFERDKGYAPSFDEVGSMIGVRSLATVSVRIQRLIARGYLHKDRNASRSLRLVSPRKRPTPAKCPQCLHEFTVS